MVRVGDRRQQHHRLHDVRVLGPVGQQAQSHGGALRVAHVADLGVVREPLHELDCVRQIELDLFVPGEVPEFREPRVQLDVTLTVHVAPRVGQEHVVALVGQVEAQTVRVLLRVARQCATGRLSLVLLDGVRTWRILLVVGAGLCRLFWRRRLGKSARLNVHRVDDPIDRRRHEAVLQDHWLECGPDARLNKWVDYALDGQNVTILRDHVVLLCLEATRTNYLRHIALGIRILGRTASILELIKLVIQVWHLFAQGFNATTNCTAQCVHQTI